MAEEESTPRPEHKFTSGLWTVGNRGRAFMLVAALACSLVLLSPAAASAQTVVQNDFEDGTLQGWTPRGGTVVLTNTTEAAANGARSLKTTGRTAITVTSDQPADGDGDGDTSPDWEVVDARHVRLRAERSPTSPAGRTYTITLTVTDSAGARTGRSVTVRVPR